MIARRLFSGEHEIFRSNVRRFIEHEMVPHHREWERAGIVPRELWRKAGEQGLLCANVPEVYGGAGVLGVSKAVIITKVADREAPWPGPRVLGPPAMVAAEWVQFDSAARQ